MRNTSTAAKLSAVGVSLVLFLSACGSDKKSDSTATTAKGDTTTTAAGSESSTTTGATTDPADNGGRKDSDGQLVIGAVLPQTGKLAQLGPPMIAGVKMAVADINKAGGVNGKEIKLILKDDGGGANDDLAATSVDQLINNDKVDAIVGAAASGTTKSILDKVVSSGTVECSPSNTGSDLTNAADKGLYFRTPPADNLQAQALAKAISDDGKQNIAIIAQNTDYGTGFVKYLKPALEDSGAKVVEDISYDVDAPSYDSDVTKAVQAKPDAIALIGYPEDGGKVLSALIKQGVDFKTTTVYVTDGMQSNELYKAVDEANPAVTEGIKGTAASAAPENGASWFPEAFKAFDPSVESPIYSAQSYDCVMAIALAAEKAKSDAPFDIAANMIDVTKGTTADAEKCDTWEKCAAALKDGKDINYEGASGALDFSEAGEPTAGSYDVYTFGADGKYTTDNQVVVGS